MFQEARELIVRDAGLVEVNNAEVLLREIVSEQGFKVGRPRGEDHLVAVDLLVLHDEGHVTEVLLVENRNEVLLVVIYQAGAHHVVGISVVLRTSDTLLCDGAEAAGSTSSIVLILIWLVLLIGTI